MSSNEQEQVGTQQWLVTDVNGHGTPIEAVHVASNSEGELLAQDASFGLVGQWARGEWRSVVRQPAEAGQEIRNAAGEVVVTLPVPEAGDGAQAASTPLSEYVELHWDEATKATPVDTWGPKARPGYTVPVEDVSATSPQGEGKRWQDDALAEFVKIGARWQVELKQAWESDVKPAMDAAVAQINELLPEGLVAGWGEQAKPEPETEPAPTSDTAAFVNWVRQVVNDDVVTKDGLAVLLREFQEDQDVAAEQGRWITLEQMDRWFADAEAQAERRAAQLNTLLSPVDAETMRAADRLIGARAFVRWAQRDLETSLADLLEQKLDRWGREHRHVRPKERPSEPLTASEGAAGVMGGPHPIHGGTDDLRAHLSTAHGLLVPRQWDGVALKEMHTDDHVQRPDCHGLRVHGNTLHPELPTRVAVIEHLQVDHGDDLYGALSLHKSALDARHRKIHQDIPMTEQDRDPVVSTAPDQEVRP